MLALAGVPPITVTLSRISTSGRRKRLSILLRCGSAALNPGQGDERPLIPGAAQESAWWVADPPLTAPRLPFASEIAVVWWVLAVSVTTDDIDIICCHGGPTVLDRWAGHQYERAGQDSDGLGEARSHEVTPVTPERHPANGRRPADPFQHSHSRRSILRQTVAPDGALPSSLSMWKAHSDHALAL